MTELVQNSCCDLSYGRTRKAGDAPKHDDKKASETISEIQLTRANIGLGNPGGTRRPIRRPDRSTINALKGGQAVAAAAHANTARAVANVGPVMVLVRAGKVREIEREGGKEGERKGGKEARRG